MHTFQYKILEKLYQDTIDKIHTDCILQITDDKEIIEFHGHKSILIGASEFFYHALLSQKESSYIFKIDDARVAHDIILSFYVPNKKTYDWKQQLEYFKCRKYLLLDTDPMELYELKVPDYGFNLLLEALNSYDVINNARLLALIKNNLPINYDIDKLDINLRKKLSRNIQLVISEVDITKIEIGREPIVNKIDVNYSGEFVTAISRDGMSVARYINYTVYVWNSINYQLIRKFTCEYGIRFLVISNSGKLVITGSATHDTINVFNIDDGKLILTCAITASENCVAISNDDRLLVLGTAFGISMRVMSDKKILLMLETSMVSCVKISDDNRIIISGHLDDTINIWSTDDHGSLIKSWKCSNLTTIAISRNNRFIVSGSRRCNSLCVWDINGNLLRNLLTKVHDENTVQKISISDDNSLISCVCTNDINIWHGYVWNSLDGQFIDNFLCYNNCDIAFYEK